MYIQIFNDGLKKWTGKPGNGRRMPKQTQKGVELGGRNGLRRAHNGHKDVESIKIIESRYKLLNPK